MNLEAPWGSHIFRANMPTFVECCSTSWFSMQTQWICCMKPSGISWMIGEVNQKSTSTWNGHGKHSYMMATWQYEQCSKSVVDDGWWLYGTNNYHHGKPRCLANQCQRKLRRYPGTASGDLAATCASPEMQVSWGWIGVIQLTYRVYQLPHLSDWWFGTWFFFHILGIS